MGYRPRSGSGAGGVKAPDLDWFVWRLVLSEHIHDSLPTILRDWTLDQALDAHEALDYLDALIDQAHGKSN